jgi:excisionase family DNA binding protein
LSRKLAIATTVHPLTCHYRRHLVEKRTLTVPEAGKALGIGRNKAYEMVKEGLLRHLRIGRRILIPKEALEALLRSGC